VEPWASFPDGCWVALDDDIGGEAVVGFAAASAVTDSADDALPEFFDLRKRWGRVRWVSVAPERWRLGIGRRLTATAVERLLEIGCEGICLETTETQEAAIALYESMGFVERGRTTIHIWTQVWMEYVSSRRDVTPPLPRDTIDP
jgi:ribosomal protein S18 acetylase RimI-like enzyme